MDTVVNQFDLKALFAALRPKAKLVPVEGFGNLLIRGITQKRNEEVQKQSKEKDIPAWKLVLVESIFTEDGRQRVFSEQDLVELGECGEGAVQALLDTVLILNNWKKDPDAKNSQTTQKDDSNSV